MLEKNRKARWGSFMGVECYERKGRDALHSRGT